ncbi:phosphoethanolamine--lipid A transferase [Arcobacter sp. 15-2]|uniref:phosphoethanolamine transferase n=1 Tax=Arcobacter sp. 15-2 TaxID=3374109 RepID=UPI00399C5C4B
MKYIQNMTQPKLILFIVLFIVFFDNYTFYTNVLQVYPINTDNTGFLLSLLVLLIAINILLFTIVSSKYTTKAILIIVLMISSLTNYFMNTYHIIVDDDMIRNVLQTNINESMDLFSIKQLLYLLFLGVIPSYFVYKVKINYRIWHKELLSKLVYILMSLLLIGMTTVIFSKHYTSFFREHKPLRYNTNPTYWIYSIGNYINKTVNSGSLELKKIGKEAIVIEHTKNEKENHTELVILVVGEAARADHFSLNGYDKKTNPLLEKEDIINFSNMFSCGTSTAYSVPCMFSIYDRKDYNYKKGISTYNILDVLQSTKDIQILWRDNNSDSKGVALRVPYEDYKTSDKNTICEDNSECRDEGMLVGLDDYISKNKGKDILIVLHQMGNHGPAYYKRYPKSFEKFTPVCKTNQLEKCTKEEISNGYDNALLYTDYFLSKTINLLKKYDNTHETAMIYMSDHGESLGENGVYLHGLPYFMAPDSQKHIGSFIWFGDEMKKDMPLEKIKQKKDDEFSHDNLFHTLLSLFEVETEIYDKSKDIINGD